MALEERLGGLSDRDPSVRLRALFDEAWAHSLEDHPEMATAVGVTDHDARLTDLSPASCERRKGEPALLLAALRTIDRDALDETDQVSYDLFERQTANAEEAARFPGELMPVTKMANPVNGLASTLSVMPRARAVDIDNATSRMRAAPTLLTQSIDLLKRGAGAGITPPRVTIADITEQIDTVLNAGEDASRNPMLVHVASRPPAIEDAAFATLQADALKAWRDELAPALARMREYLASEYLPSCRDTVSWAALPDGNEWYRYLVRRFTTTDLSPEEIHQIGLDDVASIRADMEAVRREAGHEGTFDEWCEWLRTDPQFFFTDADALVAGYRDIAKRIDPELPRLFGTLPRLPYGVREVPEHQAPSTTTAYYRPGSPEAGRPGWFYANTYDLRSRPKWEMEALTVHEAVPGHHLQISLAQELDGLPAFRTHSWGLTGFVEGWGLYSELLGYEMGLYADPYSRFGALSYQMWRAVRLVVDTGIHVFGWSRDDAIAYFAANSAKPMHDITVEVDRYIGWPGQALAYKLGQRTFSTLRAEAAATLGDAFDIRSFHDTCLLAGPLPLDVLERRVRAWIASEATGSSS